MTTKQELLTNWRATYSEIFPLRPPEKMPVDDATLALRVYLMRELELLRRELDLIRKTRVIEPAFARGYQPQLKYEDIDE